MWTMSTMAFAFALCVTVPARMPAQMGRKDRMARWSTDLRGLDRQLWIDNFPVQPTRPAM